MTRCTPLPGGGFMCGPSPRSKPKPEAPAAFRCADACGRRVRIEGLRCSVCIREAAAAAPPPRRSRMWSWRCACGEAGVELAQLHALFAFYSHRRLCDSLERTAAA